MAPARHALVIEDMPVIAMMIQDELVDLGFAVAIASTQAQAVTLAEEQCPDLIVADARLEEGSGVEAVRHICRERPIPVVFMTGDLKAVEGAIGAAAVLSKPFTTTEFRSKVGAAGLMSS